MLSPSGNLLIARLMHGVDRRVSAASRSRSSVEREPERYCRLVGGILVWIGSYLSRSSFLLSPERLLDAERLLARRA